MRKKLVILSAVFLMSASWIPAAAASNVDLGVSIGSEGIRGFYLAVSNYYRVPEREVVVVRERGIHYDELPVAFFIATRAHVAPGVVVDLRLGGMSWWDISVRYGIGPEVYYVPTNVVVKSPPYGKAYGHYKKHPREQWNRIVLQDADIINMVNLRYVSEHYNVPTERVMKMREQGRDFVTIDRAAEKEMKAKGRYKMDEGKYAKKGKKEGKDDRKKGKSKEGYSDDHGSGKDKSKNKDWKNEQDKGGKGKGKGKNKG